MRCAAADKKEKKKKIIVIQFNTIIVLKAKGKQHYGHVITWAKKHKESKAQLFLAH